MDPASSLFYEKRRFVRFPCSSASSYDVSSRKTISLPRGKSSKELTLLPPLEKPVGPTLPLLPLRLIVSHFDSPVVELSRFSLSKKYVSKLRSFLPPTTHCRLTSHDTPFFRVPRRSRSVSLLARCCLCLGGRHESILTRTHGRAAIFSSQGSFPPAWKGVFPPFPCGLLLISIAPSKHTQHSNSSPAFFFFSDEFSFCFTSSSHHDYTIRR